MLEVANTLVNKLSMKIVRSSKTSPDTDVGDIVLNLLYRQISDATDAVIDWRAFSQGGTITAANGRVYGVATVARTQNDHTLWAIRLTVKDTAYTRRKWHYNISMVHLSEEEIWLHYAKCYYDNLAGLVKPPREQPTVRRDTLPDVLFYTPEITCMCGKTAYPNEPVELCDKTLPEIIERIRDDQRGIPVLLITCPDVVHPEYIMDVALGNVIVVWCADSKMVMRLNAALPREMFTQWDTVHIFMPPIDSKTFHPTYTYEDIRKLGVDGFIDGIHRAFCENMRGKERHVFLTVEDVEGCRNRGQLIELTNRCASQSNTIEEISKRLVKLTDELRESQLRLEELGKKYNAENLREYEELLQACMTENDDLRRGISALSTRLYSSMGIGFQPDEQEHIALLQELSHAIYGALSCARSRK